MSIPFKFDYRDAWKPHKEGFAVSFLFLFELHYTSK